MSSATEVQPIDLAHLAQYTGGDPRLDAELLQMFAQQCTQTLRRFEALLAAPDARAWRETAHSLRGAAAGVGARDIADLAGCIEEIDSTGQPKKAAECLLQLESQCEVANAFIDTFLKR